MTKTNKHITQEILDRIRKIEDPYKIIIFGSYAYGTPHAESDIDIIIVLNKDTQPNTFRDKSELYLKMSRALREIEREVPLDLIVFTKPEFDRFVASNSVFSRKIIREGKVLT